MHYIYKQLKESDDIKTQSGDKIVDVIKILCISSNGTKSSVMTNYLEEDKYCIIHTDCLNESNDIIDNNKPDIIIAESKHQHPYWEGFVENKNKVDDELPIIIIVESNEHTVEYVQKSGVWEVLSQTDLNKSRIDDAIVKVLLKSKNLRYEKLLNQKHSHLTELEESKLQLQQMIEKRDFELHEAKEMLIRMQKMESLAFLAAGLSHDLQNMNSVTMSALSSMEYTLSKIDIKLPAKIHTCISLIKQSNSASTDMVTKLKGLFEEKQKVHFNFNLMDVINHVIDICRCTFPSSISVWGCSENQTAYFHGDQVSLEQALLNLCINASHAMTIMRDDNYLGGTIKVHLSSCNSSEIKNAKADVKKYWRLSISDTGVGMDDETMAQIFKPLFTTKKKGIGTGLGLLMIQNIIDSHNGLIDVESELGIGSVFHIYLPQNC